MDFRKITWVPLILSLLFQSFSAVAGKDGSDDMTDSSLLHHRVRRTLNMYVYAQGSGPIYGSNRTMSVNTYPGTGNSGYPSGGTTYSGYPGGNTNPGYTGTPYVPPSPYSPGIYGGGGAPYRAPAAYSGYSGSPYNAPPATYGYNTPQKIRNYDTPGYTAGYPGPGSEYTGGYTSPGSEDAGYGRSPVPYKPDVPVKSGYAGTRSQPTYNMPTGSGASYTGAAHPAYPTYSNRSTGPYSASYKSAGCDCPRDSFMYDVVYEMNECNGIYPFYCSRAQCDALKEQNSIIPGLGYAIYVPEQVSLPLCALARAGYEVFDIAACARLDWRGLIIHAGFSADRIQTLGRGEARSELNTNRDFSLRGSSVRSTSDNVTDQLQKFPFGDPRSFAPSTIGGFAGSRNRQSGGRGSRNQQSSSGSVRSTTTANQQAGNSSRSAGNTQPADNSRRFTGGSRQFFNNRPGREGSTGDQARARSATAETRVNLVTIPLEWYIECSPPFKSPLNEQDCLMLNPINNMVITSGEPGCDAFRSCNTNYRCNIIVLAPGSVVVAESKDIQLTLSTDCTGCHYCPETKESCLPRKYSYADLGYGSSGYSQASNYNPYNG